MHALSVFLVAGTLSAATLPAAAAPLILDFSFRSDGYAAVLNAARAAGVTIVEYNFGAYGYDGDSLTLGNDGLFHRASFEAAPGGVFDALATDLLSFRGRLMVLSCTGVAPFPDPDFPGEMRRCDDAETIDVFYPELAALSPPVERMPDLIFEGYRGAGGPAVTAVLPAPMPGLLDIAALGDFTGLTRLDVSVTPMPLGGFSWDFDARRNAWVFCSGGASCGLAQLRSLTLDLRAAGAGPGVSAPVPLPAAAGLLGAAVAGLGALRGLRRRARG